MLMVAAVNLQVKSLKWIPYIAFGCIFDLIIACNEKHVLIKHENWIVGYWPFKDWQPVMQFPCSEWVVFTKI